MIHTIQSIPIVHEHFGIDFELPEIEYAFKPANNNYFSRNTKILEESWSVSLRDCIENRLEEFQKQVLGIEQELYITDSWIAKTVQNGKHPIHDHPNSLFSGVFYLQVPENSSIYFHYENSLFKSFNFHFNYLQQNQYNARKISIPVKKNDFILFPSWLSHSVDTNTSETERIILGFNTFIRGKFGNNEYPTGLILK